MNRTLFFDFETSPLVGWGWRMWETDLFHIMQDVQVISVAWQWSDSDTVYYMDITDFKGYKPGIFNIDDKKLIQAFSKIFEKADYVCAQNGYGFDFKLLRTRMLIHGLQPHHEPKELDTKRWAKSKFLFTSNSQKHLTRQLGAPDKMETRKNLHLLCIENGDKKYWGEMRAYNKQDVRGLKEMALKLAPWIQNAPNANIGNGTNMNCTNVMCTKSDMIMRGPRPRSKTGSAQTFQCKTCGKYATGPTISAGVILR